MMTDKAWKALGLAVACGTAVCAGRLDVQAAQSETVFTSGSSIAGIGVAIDRHDRESGTIQASAASLTQEKARYLTVFDLFGNLGVAKVSGYLNVRKEPKSDSAIVGKLEADGGAEILASEPGWYKIRSGPVEGYVSKAYMEVGQAARTDAVRGMRLMARIEVSGLRVRVAPQLEAEVLGTVERGETLDVLGEERSGWVRISHEDGSGYIFAPGYATLAYTIPEARKVTIPQATLGQKVVNYAVQFVGNRYQWGGTDPNTGADCSGFVQYVMGHAAGVRLNRTSREQAVQGYAVSSGQMQPGDLIFYASKGVINHVAMYIGHGEIVHAASSRSGIKISNWDYRKPAAIRRVIN